MKIHRSRESDSDHSSSSSSSSDRVDRSRIKRTSIGDLPRRKRTLEERKGSNWIGYKKDLKVSSPEDASEKEADTVAKQVVNRKSTDESIAQKGENLNLQPNQEINRMEEEVSPMGEEVATMAEVGSIQTMADASGADPEDDTIQAKTDKPLDENREDEQHSSYDGEDERHEDEQHASYIQRAEADTENETVAPSLQRKASEGEAQSGDISKALQNSKGGGRPMNPQIMREMNEGFGTDFSGVRIHTDQRADEMNKQVNAKAFAHGQDVYFKTGNYDPNSAKGKELLAHELTHTVQQRRTINRQILRLPNDDDWIKDGEGSLYYKTEEEAKRREEKLKAEGKFQEYRVVSFIAGDNQQYWRVEMRGGVKDSETDNYGIHIFQLSDKNPYQVWLKLKGEAKTEMSFSEFKKLNDEIDFSALGGGEQLKYIKKGGKRENQEPANLEGEFAGDLNGSKTMLIAWSFDDGPVPNTDVLHNKLHFKNATWFIVKSNMLNKMGGWEKNIERYKRFQVQGGEIGLHAQHNSIDHIVWFPAHNGTDYETYSSVEKAMEDLKTFNDKLREEGIKPKFVRLPGGLASQIEYYAIHVGFTNIPRVRKLVRNAAISGRSFEELSQDLKIPNEKKAALKLGYQKIIKDLNFFKSSLKSMNLLLWGGSSNPDKINNQSWQAESSGNLSLNDTITYDVTHLQERGGKTYLPYAGKFEKKVDSLQPGEIDSYVILAHDTNKAHLSAIMNDVKKMETYAKENGVKIQYLTMSKLFTRLTGKDASNYKPNY